MIHGHHSLNDNIMLCMNYTGNCHVMKILAAVYHLKNAWSDKLLSGLAGLCVVNAVCADSFYTLEYRHYGDSRYISNIDDPY